MLNKVTTILVKLLNFSRSSEKYRDIVTCLTIVLIKTFLVDLGSAEKDGATLQNLNDLLAYLFEILNSESVNCSVSHTLKPNPKDPYLLPGLSQNVFRHSEGRVQPNFQ